MILFSVGLPSRFGEWCEAVTARLAEHALGSVETIYADTLEQFALAVMKIESSHGIIWSRQIVGRLWAALAQADKRFIVALDDPRQAVENLVRRHGMDFLLAARIVAKSCASVVSCASLPGALILRAEESEAGLVGTAEAIARHLQLNMTDAGVMNIVSTLVELDLWPVRSEANDWWDGLNEWQRALVTGSIDPYVAWIGGADLGAITWERELFYINEEVSAQYHQVASRAVDVTGRPRSIVDGPDITLPPGSWTAIVVLGLSEEAAELSYLVDIHGSVQLAQARVEPGGQRIVEVNLNFSIVEPEMITVRIWNERAAFHGLLVLGHVIMEPNKSMRHKIHGYLTAALGD